MESSQKDLGKNLRSCRVGSYGLPERIGDLTAGNQGETNRYVTTTARIPANLTVPGREPNGSRKPVIRGRNVAEQRCFQTPAEGGGEVRRLAR